MPCTLQLLWKCIISEANSLTFCGAQWKINSIWVFFKQTLKKGSLSLAIGGEQLTLQSEQIGVPQKHGRYFLSQCYTMETSAAANLGRSLIGCLQRMMIWLRALLNCQSGLKYLNIKLFFLVAGGSNQFRGPLKPTNQKPTKATAASNNFKVTYHSCYDEYIILYPVRCISVGWSRYLWLLWGLECRALYEMDAAGSILSILQKS